MLHVIRGCRRQVISKSFMMPEAVCFLFTVALKMLQSKEQPRPWRLEQGAPIYGRRPVGWLNVAVLGENGATPPLSCSSWLRSAREGL